MMMGFFSGVYPITSFGGPLFDSIYGLDDTTYTGSMTLNIIAIVDPISQLIAIAIIPNFSRRLILISGHIAISVINIMIGVLDSADKNLGVLILVIAMAVVTSMFTEPVTSLYGTEISNNSQMGIVNLFYMLL